MAQGPRPVGVFFLVVAVFWVLKPIKRGLVISYFGEHPIRMAGWVLSGAQAEQLGKVLNMVVAFAVVGVFTCLVRRYARHCLILIFCAVFGGLFLFFGSVHRAGHEPRLHRRAAVSHVLRDEALQREGGVALPAPRHLGRHPRVRATAHARVRRLHVRERQRPQLLDQPVGEGGPLSTPPRRRTRSTRPSPSSTCSCSGRPRWRPSRSIWASPPSSSRAVRWLSVAVGVLLVAWIATIRYLGSRYEDRKEGAPAFMGGVATPGRAVRHRPCIRREARGSRCATPAGSSGGRGPAGSACRSTARRPDRPPRRARP